MGYLTALTALTALSTPADLSDHSNLFAVGPDPIGDDHGDNRLADVGLQRLFQIAGHLVGRFAARLQILDQRGRDLAIGANGHRLRDFGIAPDENL